MSDIVSSAVRSRMMAGIGAKDTRPEMLVRSFVHQAGLRFRLHVGNLPGKPDLVFPRFRTVVFVHGCFWHQHPGCPKATTPRTNRAFWERKLSENRRRDVRNRSLLRRNGWRVLTVWECRTSAGHLASLVARIRLGQPEAKRK